MSNIVIMGSSISANLTAAYLKKENPHWNITVIGPEKLQHSIVGESLIELSTQMFIDLGLGDYLEQEHFHKYSLTFYYKDHLDDPSDRTYAVHEGHAISPMPSFEINRFRLRQKLIEMNRDNGVNYIFDLVTDVDTQGYRNHKVHYGRGDNKKVQHADWLIDATGRRRMLSRKHDLLTDPPVQRCAFWFRLKNFDRNFLDKITMVKRFHKNYEYYYCTHHFFGKGNWAWLIPISDGQKEMMSVGLVWRPDINPLEVSNVGEFCEHVAKENPILNDLVNSGEVVDTNFYKNYLYHSKQLYSADGWFLVGDAGNAVDPLYSPGLAFTCLQIHQVNAMIQHGEQSKLDAHYVKALETCHLTAFHTMQDVVSRQYESMHDPYQMHLCVHTVVTAYFYFLLPSWLAKYHTDPVGAKMLTKITNEAQYSLKTLYDLIPVSSARMGRVPPEAVKNYAYKSVNWKLWGADEMNMARYLSRMMVLFVQFRFKLLRDAGWRGAHKHLPLIVMDLVRALIFRLFFHNKSLRRSKIIRRLVNKQLEFKVPTLLKERLQN